MNPELSAPKVSTAYQHQDIVLSQFESCRNLPASKILDLIGRAEPNSDKIKEETLVLLARHYAAIGKDAMAWKIMSVICNRVRPAILRAMRLWRLSPTVADEFVESTISSMYEAVLNSGDSERFWEVKFWICFERRLLSALRKHRTHDDRFVEFEPTIDLAVDYRSADQPPDENLQNPAFRAIVAEGLAQLPEQLRTAFMLKHWAGFPEQSVDEGDKATIAQVMGVSGRTVRNYLMRAELLLNKWRREGNEVK